jgi:hypothetical protein
MNTDATVAAVEYFYNKWALPCGSQRKKKEFINDLYHIIEVAVSECSRYTEGEEETRG